MKSATPIGNRARDDARLRRLLFVVPYVLKHSGISLEALAEAVGTEPAELAEELELLTLVGHPPFTPGDFLDIYVEDGRVYVDLDQRFSAPPKLTGPEAAALVAAIRAAGAPSAASLLAKLDLALASIHREQFEESLQHVDTRSAGTPLLALVQSALLSQRRLVFKYPKHQSAELEQREVEPQTLSQRRGAWYLSGFCLLRSDERLFRVDRMLDAALGADVSRHHQRAQKQSESPIRPTELATVRFVPALKAAIREEYGDRAVERSNGIEVSVPADSLPWLVSYVSAFAGKARVVAPEWAVVAVRAAAERRRSNLGRRPTVEGA